MSPLCNLSDVLFFFLQFIFLPLFYLEFFHTSLFQAIFCEFVPSPLILLYPHSFYFQFLIFVHIIGGSPFRNLSFKFSLYFYYTSGIHIFDFLLIYFQSKIEFRPSVFFGDYLLCYTSAPRTSVCSPYSH